MYLCPRWCEGACGCTLSVFTHLLSRMPCHGRMRARTRKGARTRLCATEPCIDRCTLFLPGSCYQANLYPELMASLMISLGSWSGACPGWPALLKHIGAEHADDTNPCYPLAGSLAWAGNLKGTRTVLTQRSAREQSCRIYANARSEGRDHLPCWNWQVRSRSCKYRILTVGASTFAFIFERTR